MRTTQRTWQVGLLLAAVVGPVAAQVPAKPTARPTERVAAPATNAKTVAATVNGEPILEGAVQRFLKGIPADKQGQARPSVLNHLADNMLVDQYLKQGGIKIDEKQIDVKLGEMKEEMKKEKLEYTAVLKEMEVTEPELREHLAAELRWEAYVKSQATDKVLGELFAGQKEMFDGSRVRVRHVLLVPKSAEAKDKSATSAELAALRKDIEASVAKGLAALKPGTDNLAREKARMKLIEDAVAATAKAKSQCPSKQNGGDVGWFDRTMMVEPFAKTAFSMKPFELSEVVETQFGYHLILLLDRQAGKDVKLKDVRDNVQDFYAEKLRTMVVTHMRKTAKVVVGSGR